MNLNELKDSVEGIHMSESMKKDVIRHIKEQSGTGHSGRGAYQWKKMAVSAAAVLIVAGIAAVPVRAFVTSLVQERVEGMTEEEIVAISEDHGNDADSFSRDYTEEERARFEKLYRQYQEGVFPKGEILQAESKEEAGQYEFCFLMENSTFYLPERELTDEELLEIIDFTLKRDYAVVQKYKEENAEEIALAEEKRKEQVAENVKNGGVTEQQAVDTATALLADIYGVTGEGMDFNHYYDEDGKTPYYCVNWSDIISHQYYYFFINAADGSMLNTMQSNGEIADAEETPLADAEGMIEELHEKAVSFMKEKIKEPYEKEYIYYTAYDKGVASRGAEFIFAGEAGGCWAVTYLWNGTFIGCEQANMSDYQDGEEREISKQDEKRVGKTVLRLLAE